MRITLLVLTATTIGATAVFGQDPNEPKDLTSLRESYQRARSAALAPIEKKYSDALAAMKVRLTKAGNLEGALAVDTELKTILPPSTSDQKSSGDSSVTGSSRAKLKELLPSMRLDGNWEYGVFIVVFNDVEATLQPETKFTRKGPYEVIGPRMVRFTLTARDNVPNDSDMVFEIEFTRDMTQFTSSNRPDVKGKVSTVTP